MIQNRFNVIKKLYSGSSSTCYLCDDVSEQSRVVLKIFKKEKYCEDYFANEVKILEECNHPNVIRLLDTFISKEEFILVLEPGIDDLLNHVQNKGPIPENKARSYFQDLVQGLKAIHSNKIVHNDVKLENIVITKDGKAKLIDFGLSEKLYDSKKTTVMKGTFQYFSPETMMFKPHDTKSDIWSLGVSLFAALTGEFPFEGGQNQYEYSTNVLQKPPRIDLLKKNQVSDALIKLICDGLLEKDPEKRYSIIECEEFDWL